jgi:hypothetical protein
MLCFFLVAAYCSVGMQCAHTAGRIGHASKTVTRAEFRTMLISMVTETTPTGISETGKQELNALIDTAINRIEREGGFSSENVERARANFKRVLKALPRNAEGSDIEHQIELLRNKPPDPPPVLPPDPGGNDLPMPPPPPSGSGMEKRGFILCPLWPFC